MTFYEDQGNRYKILVTIVVHAVSRTKEERKPETRVKQVAKFKRFTYVIDTLS